MKKQLTQVAEFQKTFGAGVGERPRMIPEQTSKLRFDLLAEENQEYLDAINDGNLTEVADALGDALYILCGTILEHGMQHILEPVFDEIHRSNMSKTDENGKPIINGQNGVKDLTRPMGKVLKSDRYSKPDLKPIVQAGMGKQNAVKAQEVEDQIKALEKMKGNATEFTMKVKYTQRISQLQDELLLLQKN
jgi:predicted HAD superfamily Cof-like phosphohydrolase